MFLQIDPIRIFEIGGQVSKVLAAPFSTAVGNNQAVIFAVSGQIIRVVGWTAQGSGGAIGSFNLKDGNGGAVIHAPIFFPPNTNGQSEKAPIAYTGYAETSVSTGLYSDVVTAGINATFYYITYTP